MLTWMGRYGPLVETLVHHTNIIGRVLPNKPITFDGIQMSVVAWQILEYIYDHEHDDMRMIYLADRLCIPQSSFSKHIKVLEEHGLVDRYQYVGNRKNIIIKPSPKGRQVYEAYAASISGGFWGDFFEALDSVSDEDLNSFVRALQQLNSALLSKNDHGVLVKLDSDKMGKD